MDFAKFPLEIRFHILDFLTTHELEHKVANVCPEWRELIESPHFKRRISINGIDKKEENIQMLLKCYYIRELSVLYIGRWDWVMDLKRYSRLQQIHFSYCHIDSNSAIRHLVQCCPVVKELTITDCPDYSSFPEMTRWKLLKSLKFDFGGGKSFDDIAENCNVLEKLHVTIKPEVANHDYCNSAFIRLINTRGQNLKYLQLITNRYLHNSAFEALNQCNQLTYLTLDSVIRMFNSGLMALKGLHQLRTLVLGEAKNITRLGFVNFFKKSHLPNLSSLMLCDCVNFTDWSIIAMPVSCPGLKTFTLVHNNLVSDDGIQYIVDSCKNLEYLHLHTLSRLAGKFLKDIFKDCLTLQHLTVSKCQRIPTEVLSRLKVCYPTQVQYTNRDVAPRDFHDAWWEI